MTCGGLKQQLSNAAEKLDIRESSLLDLLALLGARGLVENQEVLRITGLPKTHIGRILQVFSDYLEPPSKNVVIRKEFTTQFGACLKQFDYRIGLSELEQKVLQTLKNYRPNRPEPDRQWDQFTATEETTAKRAKLLQENGDLYNRRIAFLGDDDLTSIAVALTGHPKEITVFEIDERLISLIETISSDLGLNIKIFHHDVRQPVPEHEKRKYDSIFTDPPYTPAGITTFLNQGIDLLRPRLSSRIYFCYGNSDRAREREIEIQKRINYTGLLLSTKLPAFNKYFGAESIGASSSLYLCDWTEKTKPSKITSDRIYTNQ